MVAVGPERRRRRRAAPAYRRPRAGGPGRACYRRGSCALLPAAVRLERPPCSPGSAASASARPGDRPELALIASIAFFVPALAEKACSDDCCSRPSPLTECRASARPPLSAPAVSRCWHPIQVLVCQWTLVGRCPLPLGLAGSRLVPARYLSPSARLRPAGSRPARSGRPFVALAGRRRPDSPRLHGSADAARRPPREPGALRRDRPRRRRGGPDVRGRRRPAGRRVLLLDHADAPGKKILISGGGRCNFTNLHAAPDRFLSANPHFAVSALARYTPADFLALVERHRIAWHEKTLGQLFCDGSARQIVAMLLDECDKGGVELALGHPVTDDRPCRRPLSAAFGARTVEAPGPGRSPPAAPPSPSSAPPASPTTSPAASASRWSSRARRSCRSP